MGLIIETEYPARAHEVITVSTGTAVFTSKYIIAAGENENKDCREVFMTLEDNDIRFLISGATPATGSGHKLTAGQNLTLKNRNDILNFKATRVSADGVLRITYRY